jgi:hypothetical protein
MTVEQRSETLAFSAVHVQCFRPNRASRYRAGLSSRSLRIMSRVARTPDYERRAQQRGSSFLASAFLEQRPANFRRE